MALTDTLKILITAQGAQAVAEFKRVGTSAKGNLSVAEKSAKTFGSGLTSAAAAAVTFGTLAGVGILHAANAAAESELAVTKLNTAFENSPVLVGQSTDALVEQANALQRTTVYSDEATVNMDALLATFRLTSDQIQELAPLTQDLASFWNTDLTTAAKAVGKAMMGNIGALQRQGIIIDENAFAADRFSAVMSALRENAGGFAAEEGQSLSGQLQIAKNRLGELEESLGRTFIPVITAAAEGAGELADALASIPHTALSFLPDSLEDVVGSESFWDDAKRRVHDFFDNLTSDHLDLQAAVEADDWGSIMDKIEELRRFGLNDQADSLLVVATALNDIQAAADAASEGFDGLDRAARRAGNSLSGLDNRLSKFDALTDAQDAAQEFNDTLHDQASTTRDVRSAMSRLIGAQEDLAKANHTSRDGTLDNAGAQRELRGRLRDVAAFIPAELLPMFRRIVGDLGNVREAANNVPRNIQIVVNMVGADGVLDQLNAIYGAGVRAAGAVGQTGGSLAGGGTYSGGGSSAGRSRVRESAAMPVVHEEATYRAMRRALRDEMVSMAGVGAMSN